MADSHRQQIFDALETRLKTIQVANGYETDLGNKSNKWRATDFGADELPAYNFRDPRCQTDQHTSRVHEHILDIEVVAVSVKPDAITADKQGRKMTADIIKCIGVDRTWSGLAFDTNPQEDIMTTEQQDRLLVAVQVKFQIKYRTVSFNPYS